MAADNGFAGQPVRVLGLRQLDREFARINSRLRLELRAEIRLLCRRVRDLARQKAEEQGFAAPGHSGRGRGELLAKLRYTVRGGVGLITEAAVRTEGKGAPFRYPAVWEFRKDGRGRPFLLPALDQARPEVYAGMESVLDRVTGAGLGRGGLL